MQSSAMMALRALILLVCLVAVPVFALFGKNAPDVIKSLIQKYTGNSANNSSSASLNESPAFRPATMESGSASPMPEQSVNAISAASSGSREAMPIADRAVIPSMSSQPAPSTGSNTITTSERLTQVSGQAVIGPGRYAPSDPSAMSQSPSAVPFDRGGARPVGAPGERAKQAADPTGGAAPASYPPDYFHAAEQRLRQQGATYYLLETLGPEMKQYRFFCKIAAGANGEEIGFYSIESDPLAAMDNVARQIETWRSQPIAGRLGTSSPIR